MVIAKLERAIAPESLAPPTGTVIADDDLATRFGLFELHPKTGRHAGHLFLFIDTKGVLESPDRLRFTGLPTPWPGETGFALAREGDTTWRYLGVARTTESANVWSIPEVDFRTWRRWGTGRSVSRALPEGALARAQEVVDHLLALPESERTLTTHDGKTARLLGPAERGGLRIDGGQGGFSARTISLTDLAWIAVAHDDVLKLGGTLDEPRVNRVRYLEGTPKESTRWIDSAWAIAAWERALPLVRATTRLESTGRRTIRDDNGQPLDATFSLELIGDTTTLLYYAQGGTRGTAAALNSDYSKGLEVLLARLRSLGIAIADAAVETGATEGLHVEDRRLRLPGQPYPIIITNPKALRTAMGAAQAQVGRSPGAKGGGNRTKRIRLFLELPAAIARSAIQDLGDMLA